MHITIKQFVTSNAFLKCMSLYLGYMLWLTMSNYQGSSMWAEVPLCFYNIPTKITLEAPEKVRVEIQGKKSKLNLINKLALAAHIDAQSFREGPHTIALQSDHLLLPGDFKIARYAPHNIVIHAKSIHTINTTFEKTA